MEQLPKKGLTQTAEREDTLPKLLLRNYRQWGDSRVAMRKKQLGIWRRYTWQECYERVKSLSLGLVSLGLEAGDKVSILGDNNPEWFWAELAAQAAGGVVIGLVPDSAPQEVKYIVEHSQSKFVVAQDQEQVDKLLQIKDGLPSLKKVIYWSEKGLQHYNEPILMSFAELTGLGEEYDKNHPGLFEQNVAQGKADDAYMITYTSGTTGLPKGALLTYESLFSRYQAALTENPAYESDEFVSFILPGVEVEQSHGLLCTLLLGQRLNFAEGAETVPQDLREIAPHVLAYPSRLWEQAASMMQAKIADSIWLKRIVYNLSLPIGYKVADLSYGGRRPNLFWRFVHAVAELIVFRPLKDKHGLVRVRVPYTHGAILAPDILRFFRAIGVNLRQVYGTTEGGGISVHTADDFKFESVGKVTLGRCVRISSEGEILADRGTSFLGYYADSEATERAFRGGWYHTGDAGYLDEDGHLIFIDRLGDMKQLADGSRFSPQYIESRLKFSPYIKDAIVLGGEQRGFVGAILNIDFDNVGHWAERKRVPYTTLVDLSQKPEVGELIRKEVERVNRTLPSNSRVKSFANLHKEFDPDEAEVTRTRKLRRAFVEDRYQELVEAIYGEKEEVVMETPVVYRDGRTGVVSTKVRIIHL